MSAHCIQLQCCSAAELAGDAAVRPDLWKNWQLGQVAGLGKLFSMVFEDHYPRDILKKLHISKLDILHSSH